MYVQKSFNLNPENSDKKWHVIDADGMIVGRLATEVARLLRGKHKSTFTPHTDSGDFVVVINCDKLKFTGRKWENKKYYWHTGYIGGIKSRTAGELRDKDSTEILRKAVTGMVPSTSLGRDQLRKLKLFSGQEHTHDAQKPVEYKV